MNSDQPAPFQPFQFDATAPTPGAKPTLAKAATDFQPPKVEREKKPRKASAAKNKPAPAAASSAPATTTPKATRKPTKKPAAKRAKKRSASKVRKTKAMKVDYATVANAMVGLKPADRARFDELVDILGKASKKERARLLDAANGMFRS